MQGAPQGGALQGALLDDPEPARTLGCCGLLKRRPSTATEDKLRKRALAALELMPAPLVQEHEMPSCRQILADMVDAPHDVSQQLASLLALRNVPTRELVAEMPSLASSSADGGDGGAQQEQSTWRAPEWALANGRIAAGGDGLDDGGTGGIGAGKRAGKPRMMTTTATRAAADASLPAPPAPPAPQGAEATAAPDTSSDLALAQALWLADGGGRTHAVGLTDSLTVLPLPLPLPRPPAHDGALWARPEAHILDVLVHAMRLAREHAEVQVHACSLLASLALELVRGGLCARRGGDANLDTASRAAMREQAERLRTRAFRGGVVGALVCAMRTHAARTPVLHAAFLALYALVDGDGGRSGGGGSEGKHQAAEAGCLELIAEQLQRRPPPLCIWNMGRVLLMALIRNEPALRRRARRAFPRWSVEFNLWVLSL